MVAAGQTVIVSDGHQIGSCQQPDKQLATSPWWASDRVIGAAGQTVRERASDRVMLAAGHAVSN